MVDSVDSWIPLEGNPEIMDAFAQRLGVSQEWAFSDVYSLDPEMVAMVPKPVLAVIMVYPITDKSEVSSLGHVDPSVTDINGGDIYFMQQTIPNACGTVALVHTIANNLKSLGVDYNNSFAQFIKMSRTLSPLERCIRLGQNNTITEAHSELSIMGQSDVPAPTSDTNLHFVAFIHHNGKLYEMDGRKPGPVEHRPTTADSILEDSVEVVKQFIERDPDLLTFSLLALAKV